MKNLFFKLSLYVKWAWGFPAAVVSNYRRQTKLDREMQDALIDDTFLALYPREYLHPFCIQYP